MSEFAKLNYIYNKRAIEIIYNAIFVSGTFLNVQEHI